MNMYHFNAAQKRWIKSESENESEKDEFIFNSSEHIMLTPINWMLSAGATETGPKKRQYSFTILFEWWHETERNEMYQCSFLQESILWMQNCVWRLFYIGLQTDEEALTASVLFLGGGGGRGIGMGFYLIKILSST